MTDDELTPSEKRALEALPKERAPSAFLEERVVRVLRREKHLHSREGRRAIPITGWRIAGAVAACIAFVVCGFALGYWASSRPEAVSRGFVSVSNAMPLAYSVQQAGTDYVLALEKLAAYSDSTQGEEAQLGREVALNILYTAADQMVKIVPKDVLARCIVHAITTTGPIESDRDGENAEPRTIQF
jgi:hypothetical protein